MQESHLAKDLLKSATDLVSASGRRKPRQANLRRAVSTAHYALFHCMCSNCANVVIGKRKNHGKAAWRQVYRAVQHAFAKGACDASNGKQKIILQKFPIGIKDFANHVYSMQIKRHKADYDRYEKITKSSILADIEIAESAIQGFESFPDQDRRAFAALVPLQQPRS